MAGARRTKRHPHIHTYGECEMDGCAGGTDKHSNAHGYTFHYEKYFSHLKDEPIKLLELGIHTGGSLLMWEKYFTTAEIYGVDIADLIKNKERFSDRVHILIEDIMKDDSVDRILGATGALDIVVDDCGHTAVQQKRNFQKFFPYLKENGIYVIEDLYTSYWPMYGGGYREPGSAIEYLKGLIDHLFHEVYKKNNHTKGWQNADQSRIHEPITWWDQNIYALHFFKGICFIIKGSNR
jgi:hypothetical protein